MLLYYGDDQQKTLKFLIRIYQRKQSAIQTRIDDNEGVRLLDLLDYTDVPYFFFTWIHFRKRYEMQWRYHKTNRNCNERDRDMFAKYNEMSIAECRKLTGDEAIECKRYKLPDGRFVTKGKRCAFQDGISKEGWALYKRLTGMWLSLLRNDKYKEQLDELWDEQEREHKRIETIMTETSLRKKRKREEEIALEEEGSPTCVMHLMLKPGDQGWEEMMGLDDAEDDDGTMDNTFLDSAFTAV